MSQKAWMNAYTKGSKALQDRLAKVHAKNPEFQDFVKKHGFGGNLSVKQSGQQKKSSVATVKPTTLAHPERGNLDRLAVIKAAAEKQKDRRHAASNRVSFGGELGGSFSMTGVGFRRYSEDFELRESKAEKSSKRLAYYSDSRNDPDWIKSNKRDRMIAVAKKKLGEDIAYKDGHVAMYRGGWIAKRGGKQIGPNVPTKEFAQGYIDASRKSIGQKTLEVLKRKKQEIARGLGRMSLSTESAANRNRSWDSAVLPVEHDHGMTTPHPKAKLDALRAAGKHEQARELERSWLKKSMAKAKKTENSNE